MSEKALNKEKLLTMMNKEVANIDYHMARAGSEKEAFYYKGMKEGVLLSIQILNMTDKLPEIKTDMDIK